MGKKYDIKVRSARGKRRHAPRIRQELSKRGLYDVARAVAKERHVLVDDLLGPRKTEAILNARRVLFARLVELGLSLREIGSLLERDASAIHKSMKLAV